MISGGAIPKIYRFAESPDFPINPVKTQNKSCQTYKVAKGKKFWFIFIKTLKLIERKLKENLLEKERVSGIDCFSLGNWLRGTQIQKWENQHLESIHKIRRSCFGVFYSRYENMTRAESLYSQIPQRNAVSRVLWCCCREFHVFMGQIARESLSLMVFSHLRSIVFFYYRCKNNCDHFDMCSLEVWW